MFICIRVVCFCLLFAKTGMGALKNYLKHQYCVCQMNVLVMPASCEILQLSGVIWCESGGAVSEETQALLNCTQILFVFMTVVTGPELPACF